MGQIVYDQISVNLTRHATHRCHGVVLLPEIGLQHQDAFGFGEWTETPKGSSFHHSVANICL